MKKSEKKKREGRPVRPVQQPVTHPTDSEQRRLRCLVDTRVCLYVFVRVLSGAETAEY